MLRIKYADEDVGVRAGVSTLPYCLLDGGDSPFLAERQVLLELELNTVSISLNVCGKENVRNDEQDDGELKIKNVEYQRVRRTPSFSRAIKQF